VTRPSAQVTPRPIALSAVQRRRANLFRWFSPKANRILDCESYLEFRHLLWREVDPHIVALCERPTPRIEARIQGQSLKYTFDAWIRRRNGEELFIEVKPRAKLEGQEPRPPRWDLVRAWCDANSVLCDWVTDEHLAVHSQLLDNWEQLLPFACAARQSMDEGVREAVRALFDREPSLTLSSVPGFLLTHDPHLVTAETVYLLYQGELTADLAGRAVSRALVIERARAREHA
jgi:hypothetical protein